MAERDAHSTFLDITYANYQQASLRTHPASKPFARPFSILPWRTIPKLLVALYIVFINCFWPYILSSLIITSIYTYVNSHSLEYVHSILLVIALHTAYTVYSSASPAKTKPGLYFSPTERNLGIVAASALLNAEHSLPGAVSNDFGFTPWIFNGDLCTLLPFLCNSPPRIKYSRRWVRVPLAQGPLSQPLARDAQGEYEGVAVDYILSDDCTSSIGTGSGGNSLLILAGLSGGSQEGYCRDLVDYSKRLGWNCFVLLGRGLSGEPNLSNATFHGARTSDASALAKAIKASFGGKVMAVGVSLGGIIICNGLCRGDLSDSIDGAVSISGCCENARNNLYKHGRTVWQPLLAHGIKGVFADLPIMAGKLQYVLGDDAEKILQDVYDIFDFDSRIITPMNGYDNVNHYYDDASATCDRLRSCAKPLLEIHAVDDPITSADCIPSTELTNGLTPNMFALFSRSGGHVGWPLGWTPWSRRWEFQNRLVMEFLASVAALPSVHDVK